MGRYVLGCIKICIFFNLQGMDNHLVQISSSKSTQCKAQKLELSALSSQNNSLASSSLIKPDRSCTNQKELLHEIQSLFKKQENNLQLYWSDIKTTFTPAQPTLEQQTQELEEQARQLRLEKFNTFSNTASDCFDGASTLIYTFGNPKTAAKIQNFGAASLKIASSMNAIIEGGAATGGASLINPYVGLTMGVCSLIGLFQEPDDNNGFEILMECMQHYMQALSQQMYEQFEHTMFRFDRVENKIDQYGMAMLNEFFLLHQKQDYSLEKLFELRKDFMEQSSMLQGAVSYVNESLAQKYSSLTANLEALRTEKINEIVHNAIRDSLKADLPLEKFEKHVDKLHAKATVRALEAHVTGGNIDTTNYHAIATALTAQPAMHDHSNVLQHPVYSNINLIRRYLGHYFGDDTQQLANPLIFIQCSDALSTILQKKLLADKYFPASQNAKELMITMLKQLINNGSSLVNFIKKAHRNNYVEKVAQQQHNAVKNISNIYTMLRNAFEQEKTKLLQERYNQTLSSESSHIRVSPQMLDYESQKQKIKNMYLYSKIAEIDKSPGYKARCSFTYQCKNITGTMTRGFKFGCRENSDWSFCNSLLRRSAETYEATARQCTQDKISQHLQAMQSDNEQNYLSTFKLFELPQKPEILHPMSRVMHSPNQLYQLPVLALPQSYTLPDYYLLQEQQGRGVIRHEYRYDEKNWYVESYFVSNHGTQTLILSSQVELDSTNSPHVPYDHAFNHWYGGYFAKKNDLFQYNGLDYAESAFSWSGHIPPLDAYTGLCETWQKNAQTTIADKKTENQSIIAADAALKREFNETVLKQMVPGTELYDAVKKLDAHSKLLDALLALTCNQEYQKGKLSALQRPTNLQLTSEQAVKEYLNHYSNPHTGYSNTNQHLLYYLGTSLELINALVAEAKQIDHQPLQDLLETLNRLQATLHLLESKTIVKESAHKEPPINDSEIALLRKQLEINMIQQEKDRNEIKQLTEKVNMLLDLLTQDKK
jgi:hypothetical protein